MIYNKTGTQLTRAYNKNGNELYRAYDVDGDVVFSKGTIVDYSSYIVEPYISVSLSQMQGFDINSGVLFQFRANSSSVSNIMCTINTATGTIIQNNISAVSDHGDSASFLPQKYDVSDTYPLICVTSDTNPAKVYVNRVTQTSSQLIKTFSFPLDKTGYYAAFAYDDANDITYMVGYNASSSPTKTIISRWDKNNCTENEDGTFTPEFISSIETTFWLHQQGIQFHDGLIWIAVGYPSQRGYIYAVDPTDGRLYYTVDTGSTTELEGLSFISPTEMIFGLQGGTYKKVTFASA